MSRKFAQFFYCFLYFVFVSLHSDQGIDKNRWEDFYDEFVCEEKDITSEVSLTESCTSKPVPPSPPPPPPPPTGDLLPIVLINNTGLPDSDVYFVVFGTEVTGCSSSGPVVGNQTFISFGPQPGPFSPYGVIDAGTYPTGPNVPPASTYSYKFSDIPTSNGRTVIYVPIKVQGGEIMFSINNSLPLVVTAGSIAVPNPALSTDTSYNDIYGQFEFTLYPSGCADPSNPSANLNQLTVDATCVDYFGLPIQFTVFPNNITAGVLLTRHQVLTDLKTSFNNAIGANSQTIWNSLIIQPGGVGNPILRILGPGESMFGPLAPIFDINYFDNAAQYGYSWAENVWYGTQAYYKNNTLSITTSSGNNFLGKVSASNEFTFISTSTGETYAIPWQNSGTLADATSASLFNVSTNLPGMTYTPKNGSPCTIGNSGCPASSDAVDLTKILSSAIITGIIPGGVTKLTNSGPSPTTIDTYYLPNQNLPNNGDTFGPWFDLYSVGIIGAGTNLTGNDAYAYAYDDYLYSQSPTLQNVAPSIATISSDTYLSITLNEYSDE